MSRGPPSSTPTDSLVPSTTLFRSCNLERIDLLGARWHASQQWPAVTDHLVDEEPPAQVYLGWADGTRFEVHCCRYPTITEEEKITRIGIPPKQLHFGTSGTMLVQICHCRVDHGMQIGRAHV